MEHWHFRGLTHFVTRSRSCTLECPQGTYPNSEQSRCSYCNRWDELRNPTNTNWCGKKNIKVPPFMLFSSAKFLTASFWAWYLWAIILTKKIFGWQWSHQALRCLWKLGSVQPVSPGRSRGRFSWRVQPSKQKNWGKSWMLWFKAITQKAMTLNFVAKESCDSIAQPITKQPEICGLELTRTDPASQDTITNNFIIDKEDGSCKEVTIYSRWFSTKGQLENHTIFSDDTMFIEFLNGSLLGFRFWICHSHL